jgi:hypothetical protein
MRRHAALALLFLLGTPLIAFAGFGITPPYVYNDRLTRSTVYEQKITLVRSDPTDDLRAQVTLNIPEIESWFTIDRGNDFILPKGVTQVPIYVRVTVPDDAVFKKYKGAIRIRTSPVNESGGGGVSIALGAQIDVAVEVVDQILDFEVRKIRITDLETGRKKWGLFFPGKIRFFMTVENTGNVAYAPTKVQFDIYDQDYETLLETTYNTNKIQKIAPFASEELLAELPTRLSPGRYRAKYTIYRGEDIAQQNEISLSVLTPGAVLGYEGYGFDGLYIEDWIKVVAVVTVPLILFLVIVILMLRMRNAARRRARGRVRKE